MIYVDPHRYGVAECDPLWSKVSLLLPMNGSSGSTTFTDLSTGSNTPTVYGAAQISTASYKWNGSSGFFNGIDAYLSLPGPIYTFGTNDFTIEMWINVLSATQTYPYTLASSAWSVGGGFYMIVKGPGTGWGGSGLISFNGASDLVNGPTVESTTAIRGTGWHHIAVTRKDRVTRLFVDGVNEATHTAAGVANYAAPPVARVMRGYSPGNDDLSWEHGYINGLRITNGVARYTSNFAIPTKPAITGACGIDPCDPLWGYVRLLCNAENGWVDESDDNRPIGPQGGVLLLDTSVVKNGTTSFYSDGIPNAMVVVQANPADSGPNSGTFAANTEFCMEGWVRPRSVKRQSCFGFYDGTTTSARTLHVGMTSSGYAYFQWVYNFGSQTEEIISDALLPLNTWTHIAATRSTALGMRLWINGVLQTATFPSAASLMAINWVGDFNRWAFLGKRVDTTRYECWHGNVDDIRYTYGALNSGACRYTSNFTPPNSAFYTSSCA